MGELDGRRIGELIMDGLRRSHEDVAALESKLAVDPYDLETRLRLIGAHGNDPRSVEHALWMIEHMPHEGALEAALVTPLLMCDESSCALVTQAWDRSLSVLDEHSAQAGRAYLNAALWALGRDAGRHVVWREHARRLLLDPESLLRISHLEIGFLRRYSQESPDERMARLEVIALDEKLKLYSLDALAAIAFDRGYFDRARRYSTAILADEAAGAVIKYRAHSILGRLAVRESRIGVAMGHLRDAVKSIRAVAQSTPDMNLATELLGNGADAAVLECVGELSSLGGNALVESWVSQVTNGRVPRLVDYLG